MVWLDAALPMPYIVREVTTRSMLHPQQTRHAGHSHGLPVSHDRQQLPLVAIQGSQTRVMRMQVKNVCCAVVYKGVHIVLLACVINKT